MTLQYPPLRSWYLLGASSNKDFTIDWSYTKASACRKRSFLSHRQWQIITSSVSLIALLSTAP